MVLNIAQIICFHILQHMRFVCVCGLSMYVDNLKMCLRVCVLVELCKGCVHMYMCIAVRMFKEK